MSPFCAKVRYFYVEFLDTLMDLVYQKKYKYSFFSELLLSLFKLSLVLTIVVTSINIMIIIFHHYHTQAKLQMHKHN